MKALRLRWLAAGKVGLLLLAGDAMNRNDVWQNRTGPVTDNGEAAPVRELFDVVADIQRDAAAEPARYLSESEVPYGGE